MESVMKSKEETPPEVVELHNSILRLVVDYEMPVAMSAMYTIIAKVCVVAGVRKEDCLAALSMAYDGYVLYESEGPMQ
jgi:hypothetical protein